MNNINIYCAFMPCRSGPPSCLGYAQASTTMNVYSHALKSAGREAADRMEEVFNGTQNIINEIKTKGTRV